MSVNAKVFRARQAMGRSVRGTALVAHDGFSARYDLDRIAGIFSRPTHKLAGQSYVGRILVLDTAKGGVASAWMLHEMQSRGMAPLAFVFNSVNPISPKVLRWAICRCLPGLTKISLSLFPMVPN
jgi:Uncharacterized conserved protein